MAIAAAVAAAAAVTAAIISSQAQANAEDQEAESLRRQADFTAESEKRQIKVTQREGERVVDRQMGGFAKSGWDPGGSTLDVVEQTMSDMNAQIDAIRRDSGFRQNQYQRSATNYENQATATRWAGYFGGAGSAFQGGAQVSALSDSNSGATQKLGGDTRLSSKRLTDAELLTQSRKWYEDKDAQTS